MYRSMESGVIVKSGIFCVFQTRSPSKAASMFSGTQEKCATCGKTAYPLEKVGLKNLIIFFSFHNIRSRVINICYNLVMEVVSPKALDPID